MIKSAIAFVLSCAAILALPELPPPAYLLSLIPIIMVVLYLRHYFLLFAVAGLLVTWFQCYQLIDNRLDKSLYGQTLTVSGQVISIPQQNDQRVRFLFKPDKLTPALPHKIRVSWYRPFADNLAVNQNWQLKLRLKPAVGLSNPGSFDYEKWLFQQGIGAVSYVKPSDTNKLITSSNRHSIDTVRHKLANFITLTLDESETSALLVGLTTGMRTSISSHQWQTLSNTGTSHLLAISGLHIGLAAVIGFYIFKWLWQLKSSNLLLIPAKKCAVIGAIIFATAYAALAGFSVPTQRALLMLLVVSISLLMNRSIKASHILATSLIIILTFDPLAILSAGFWLSFAAVAIIFFTFSHRHPPVARPWLKIHCVIAIGLTPFLLLFFNQTSLITPLANFIAVPVISFIVVPLSLAASFSWLFSPQLTSLLFTIADITLSHLWVLLDKLSVLPFATWSPTQLPFAYWLIVLLGIILLLMPKGFPAKWLGLLGFTPFIFYQAPRPNDGEFWFTLLDVGQGLSTVIVTKNHTLIYDVGEKISPQFDMGAHIVVPYLNSVDINHIDKLIVSHGDNDHIGGLHSLAQQKNIGQILSSVTEKIPKASSCHQGQQWVWDNVLFQVLHPRLTDQLSENNFSCVLKVSNKTGSVLLTGDIEKQAENLLIERQQDLTSTLLIAPHHGSNTSSSYPFIRHVNPQSVLIPAGYMNRFNFPHPKVIQRYKTQNIPILSTAQSGAIEYRFNKQGLQGPIRWRQHSQKIWRLDTTD
jgi:competence protein ComEC